MDAAFEYYNPFLHPLVVHFPIVLLLLTAGAVLVWSIRDRRVWLRAAALLGWLGSVGAVVASKTGEALEEEVAGTPIVETLVDLHDTSADWTVLLAFVLTLCLTGLLLGDRFWSPRSGTPGLLRFVLALLAIATGAAVAWTGHVGGLMVWGVPH